MYRVLLHNDDVNRREYVVQARGHGNEQMASAVVLRFTRFTPPGPPFSPSRSQVLMKVVDGMVSSGLRPLCLSFPLFPALLSEALA